jgi:hypothetical protein
MIGCERHSVLSRNDAFDSQIVERFVDDRGHRVRVSTSDRGQSAQSQLQPLQEAAGRLGCTVTAIRISGCQGRAKRPGPDASGPRSDGREQQSRARLPINGRF